MDIKELKKLIQEEKNKLSEATVPGSLAAKVRAAAKQEVEPEDKTQAIPGISVDPSAKTVIKKPQTSSSPAIQSPEDFYKGILRIRNELQTKFFLELKNKEVSEMIDDIVSEEIEKLRSKYPDLNIGSKLG